MGFAMVFGMRFAPLVLVACAHSVPNQTSECRSSFPELDLHATPRADPALEQLAISMCPTCVTADPETYARLERDVAAIKAANPDVSTLVHRPRHDGKTLLVKLSDPAETAVLAGDYAEWDCLNEELGFEREHLWENTNWAELASPGTYNSEMLVEPYLDLDGIEYVEPNYSSGDGGNICATAGEETWTYVFRNGWGDCPAGCIDSEYWHFSVLGETVTLLDYAPSDAAVPGWAEGCARF